MNAVVIHGVNAIDLRQVPKPRRTADDAIVRVKAVGLCGTDIELLGGNHPSVKNSLSDRNYRIPGHEWSGVIEETGEAAVFRKGDRVVGEVGVRCGKCIYCKGVRQGVCENLLEIGIDRDGAMADYVSVPFQNLHEVSLAISFEEAALIEPTTVVLRALKKLNERRDRLPSLEGRNVAVIGDGPIGLLANKIIRSLNPHSLIAVGKSKRKLSMAERFGSDMVIDTSNSENAVGTIRKHVGGLPIDLVVEAAGGRTSVDEALGIVRKGGTILVLGLHGVLLMDFDRVVMNEIKVVGSVSGSSAWEDAIQRVSRRNLVLKDLITDRIPLQRANEAFEWAREDPDRVKTVMTP